MKNTLYLMTTCLGLVSCTRSADFEAEKKAILAIHEEQRNAHFEKKPHLLFPDSVHEYIEINRGSVRKPTHSERINKFKAYFESVDFVKWDDTAAPIISFSDDGSMATSVVEKMVITKDKQSQMLDTTYFSWLAVYKKENGKWYLHRMGSSNK